MQIIELDPGVWMRGGQSHLLWLEGDKRRQCCIGIACTAFGVPDEKIDLMGTLDAVARRYGAAEVPLMFRAFAAVEGKFMQSVYSINDDPDISDDTERVANINAELERLGADFRFVLKEQQ